MQSVKINVAINGNGAICLPEEGSPLSGVVRDWSSVVEEMILSVESDAVDISFDVVERDVVAATLVREEGADMVVSLISEVSFVLVNICPLTI